MPSVQISSQKKNFNLFARCCGGDFDSGHSLAIGPGLSTFPRLVTLMRQHFSNVMETKTW